MAGNPVFSIVFYFSYLLDATHCRLKAKCNKTPVACVSLLPTKAGFSPIEYSIFILFHSLSCQVCLTQGPDYFDYEYGLTITYRDF